MTVVAIHQPNYLPWLGYFRKIAQSQTFVFYDNVQMPIGKSLVSRNKIKTADGPRWLTVPTRRDSHGAAIAMTPIVYDNWQRKHLGTLKTAYAGSPWLPDVLELLGDTYAAGHPTIAEMNIALIQAIADLLGIEGVRYLIASQMTLRESGADSIAEILERTNATSYLTGSGAGSMRHLDVDGLRREGTDTRFVSTEFPEYAQRHGAFEPNLSIVDALLNCGPERTRALLGRSPAEAI